MKTADKAPTVAVNAPIFCLPFVDCFCSVEPFLKITPVSGYVFESSFASSQRLQFFEIYYIVVIAILSAVWAIDTVRQITSVDALLEFPTACNIFLDSLPLPF